MVNLFLKKILTKYFNSKFGIFTTGIAQALSLLRTRKSKKILWVGDSHASFISGIKLSAMFGDKSGKSLVWIGPRLMYSISQKGFPLPVRIACRLVMKNTNIVFVLGEIDVRMHLAQRLELNFEFIQDYVHEVKKLLQIYGLKNAIVLSPIPPSDAGKIDAKFPRKGSLAERIKINSKFTNFLEVHCVENGIRFVDISKLVSKQDGSLDGQYTLDGCHCNQSGSVKIKNEISNLLR